MYLLHMTGMTLTVEIMHPLTLFPITQYLAFSRKLNRFQEGRKKERDEGREGGKGGGREGGRQKVLTLQSSAIMSLPLRRPIIPPVLSDFIYTNSKNTI